MPVYAGLIVGKFVLIRVYLIAFYYCRQYYFRNNGITITNSILKLNRRNQFNLVKYLLSCFSLKEVNVLENEYQIELLDYLEIHPYLAYPHLSKFYMNCMLLFD
jgi:hypothetical protein